MESDDQQLTRQLVQMLESLQSAGVQQLPKGTPDAFTLKELSIEPAEPDLAESVELEHDDPVASTDVVVNKSEEKSLEVLAEEVSVCTRCEELSCTRTQTVFGVGSPSARLCFLGEAPGADEDRLGEPFVGRAGQLLDKILSACNLTRSEVYILNILKCRPPNNRNPTPEESQNCREFLDQQLHMIQPEFICCLGAVAAQNLLDTPTAIGRLRGRVHLYQGIKVLCTYHPAYLLRNPSAKKLTWEDMKLLMREMGTPVE